MTELEVLTEVEKGLRELLFLTKNLRITGPVTLTIDCSEGVPGNYGYTINKKSCISKRKNIE